MVTAFTVFLISSFALGAILTVVMVGKPRDPITGPVAACDVAFSALLILCVLYLAAN